MAKFLRTMLTMFAGRSGSEALVSGPLPVAAEAIHAGQIDQLTTELAAARQQAGHLAAEVALTREAMLVAEYAPDGSILAANANFLKTFGFGLAELKSKTHRDLVAPRFRESRDYRELWERLARAESVSGLQARSGKDGGELEIQSYYGVLLNTDGTVSRIIELATDVTSQNLKSRHLQEALDEIQKVVKLSVDGDLVARVRIGDGMSGEISRLCADVNLVLNARMVLIRRVKLLTVDVRDAALEISKGNTSLSQLTEAQAASLEQTTASMAEMTTNVKKTAEHVGQARDFAVSAGRQAEAGGEAVDAAVAAMRQINISSRKIADIISVIDEIAFQTNLLALNAAVEAARAGEQGRGFAVVASEVRNLAGRSATAAKEIKSLIQDSVGKVEDGSKLVDISGKTLADIVAAVRKVTDVVSKIAAASQEQSGGIDQVNKAVMQIDEATQQNAALVEETAAASQAIVDQIQALHSTIAHYRVDPDEPAVKKVSRAA